MRNFNTPSQVYYTLNSQNGSGAVRRATLGNGVVEQYGYEPQTGRLASIQTGPSGSATLQNLSYDWDLAGNLEQRVDQLQSRTEVFNYDALDRLTGVVRNSATIFSLTYNNLIGNISSKTDSSGTFNYSYGSSRPHAVTAFGSMTFGYDLNGNMTSRNGGAITWTSYNLPSHLQRASGEYSDFLYGADRDRYRQIEVAGAISSTRHYASPGLFEVLILDGGASRRDYHYIHADGRAVAQFTAASGVEADELTYLHRDHQGSVAATTSNTGTLLDRFEYDPFGVRSTPVGSDARMHRGYTGHEHLEALELVHMNGRVQDPLLGRFLSPDPFVQAPYDSRSLNRYSYVWNNPMTLVDPSGFQSKPPELPTFIPATTPEQCATVIYFCGDPCSWVPEQCDPEPGDGGKPDDGGWYCVNSACRVDGGSRNDDATNNAGGGGSGTTANTPVPQGGQDLLLRWFGGVPMDQRSLMNGTEGNLLSNTFQTYLEWREEAGKEFAATLEAASNGDEAAMQDLSMRFLPGGGLRSVVGRNLAARGSTAVARVGERLGTVHDVLRNPNLLTGKGPAEVNMMLGRTPGWRTEALGQGSHQGQGWVLREYLSNGEASGRMLRWHPGGGRHGPDPYWLITQPNVPTVRLPAGGL